MSYDGPDGDRGSGWDDDRASGWNDRAYCPNCGESVERGTKFCSSCGARQQGHEGNPAHGGRHDADRMTVATEDSNTGMAAIAHILALFLWVIGPILIYAVTDDPFVKENAANATNWQIMFTIYMLISFVLVVLLIGILFIFVLILLDIVFILIATIKAADGEAWTYPLTPKLL